MRFGYRRRLVVSAAACALVVFAAASASAAKPVFSGAQAVSSRKSPAAAASASGSWGVGIEAALPANATPTDQGAGLSWVSCPLTGNCSAVGSYTDSSGNQEGLLLTEAAGSWATGVEAVLPANANPSPSSHLESVSCASAGNCSAVGAYEDNSGNGEGLLLTETAGSWSAGVEAALPANASHSNPLVVLRSVSCASAGNCTAVGFYMDGLGDPQGLLLTETAGSWATGVEATLPADAAGTTQSAVLSVSCASAGNCTAVGYYGDSSGFHGLLLSETAGSWATGVEAVLPANAATPQFAALTSVSCASAGNCSAVGYYDDQGLLLTETAGTWASGVEAVLPANATTTDAEQVVEIGSVSCPSPGDCSAVGTYYDNTDNIQGLLLTETAGTWASGVEALPANAAMTSPGGQEAGLNSVSCPSPGNCGAVGTSYDSSGHSVGLLLTEDAGSWATGAEATLPANAATPTSSLYSVSCASAGNCSAAGYYYADTTSDFFTDGLLIGGSPPKVKLDISKSDTGSGTVSSVPTGIHCGSTCSGSFDSGTSLTLTGTPSAGSRFQGWSGGGCSGIGICQVNTGIGEQTVTATFSFLPCVVPKLKGKTLKAAKHAIRTHSCRVGKITHATSGTIEKGHVISQKPRPGRRLKHRARVDLVLSKGRR